MMMKSSTNGDDTNDKIRGLKRKWRSKAVREIDEINKSENEVKVDWNRKKSN